MTTRYVEQRAVADLADIPATSRWVAGAAGKLHLLDYGGEGAPVVVLPGITSPATTMDFVARALVGRYRPLVVDLRGRGLSDDAQSYTLADYAEDTEAIVLELGLHAPILLGHSLGARIAAATAARAKVGLRGVVLVDPPMSGPGRGRYPTSLESFFAQLDEARGGTEAQAVARFWPRWPRRELELRARWLSSCSESAIAATHEAFETEDFFDVWSRVPEPAAFIYGRDSVVVTEAGAAEARRMRPQARFFAVPDAGHMVFWDNPPAAAAALTDALASISG